MEKNITGTVTAQQMVGYGIQGVPAVALRDGIFVSFRNKSSGANTILEVDRAIENLFKSGKAFNAPARRDSVPLGAPARSFPDQYCACPLRAPCFLPPAYHKNHILTPPAAGPPRHNSVGGGASGNEFSGDARSFSASNLQSFYATQRHQPARGASEAEQVLQAKRRMAAQRERELRNYHQEQQYNRSRPPSSLE